MHGQGVRRSSALMLLAVLALTTPAGAGKPGAGGAPGTVGFAGYTWQIKSARAPMGPGPNVFSASNVTVDRAGALHLHIAKAKGGWSCAEVILDHTLGYGTYEWTVRGPIDALDRNVVLGLFTWDDANTSPTNREIDLEVARWGNAADPTNAQYVVQPYDRDGNLQRLAIPTATTVRLRFTWSPGRVDFGGSTTRADGVTVPLPTSTNTSADVPTSLTERAHMNLWLYGGHAPANGQPVDIAVSGFTFTPA